MYIKTLAQYCRDVLKHPKKHNKWEILAVKRHQNDLKKSKNGGAFKFLFNEKLAVKACKFIECLKHVKGPLAGENIKLEPFQIFIVCSIFGWVNASNFRRFIQVYIEIPRGNGKSTLCSAIALFMLCCDGEQGADVYSFATTRDQARIVFDDALAMARGNKNLLQAFGVTCLKNSIVIIGTNSKFMPKSADAQTLDGLNTHCGIIDELHAHKTREVYDVVKTSLGKRDQPLMFCITTAGFTLDGICMEQHRLTQKILSGNVVNDSYFGIIFTIDDGDDWKTESALQKANPNWGVSVTPKVVMSNLHEAMQSPSAEKNFLTKHLCVWCNADTQWLEMARWRKCFRPSVELSEFWGQPCIFGVDLATKIDISAIVRLFWRVEDDERVHFYVFPTFFLPSERIENSSNSQYSGWVKQGLIEVTDGPVTDLSYIERYIARESQMYETLFIGYDPWQATQMAQNLRAEGAPMIEINATVLNFSEPMKQIQALTFDNRLHTDGNPVLEWMASNVICHTDAKENIYPRKEKNENKIDGVVALIMAMNIAIKKNVEHDYLPSEKDIDYKDLFI